MPTSYSKGYEKTFPWAAPCVGDKYSAKCTWCDADFKIDTMGRTAFTSHEKGLKHRRLANARSTTAAANLFLQQQQRASEGNVPRRGEDPREDPDDAPASLTDRAVPPSSSSAAPLAGVPVVAAPRSASGSSQATMMKYVLKDEVTTAEIKWVLHMVKSHMSLRKGAESINVIQDMLPGSDVAKGMKLDRTKIGYLINFGLAPYFLSELQKELTACSEIVVGFDESLNKIAQKEQLDVSVRYWPEGEIEIKCRYLKSIFLTATRAQEIKLALKSCLDFVLKNVQQFSMDGPNVNWKLQRDFATELKGLTNKENFEFLNIGSCGLHTTHNSFRAGVKKSEWGIGALMRDLFYLFKNFPLRRSEYTAVTESSVMPLKFCEVRWIENKLVASRTLEMVPHLRKYFKAIEEQTSSKMKSSHPDFKRSFAALVKSKRYSTVKAAIKDPLIEPKLTFFIYLASIVEPFLTSFQSETPMAPYLFDDLTAIVRTLMRMVVKPEVLKTTKEKTLIDLDLTNDNLLNAASVDIGFSTKAALSAVPEKAASGKEKLLFRNACRSIVVDMVTKMSEKSPLTYPLTRYISCLSPEVIGKSPTIACKRMEFTLEHLVETGHMAGTVADSAKSEFQDLLGKQVVVQTMKAHRRKERLDRFWLNILDEYDEQQKWASLRMFVRKILLLSHGNAASERGFSVNAECVVVNQTEESLVAQRTVYDAVHDAGNSTNIVVTKSLIHSARNAHSRYQEFLKKKKDEKSEEEKQRDKKRKAEADRKALEAKKAHILKEAERQALLIDEEISMAGGSRA